jgi:SagB-type dehydrogenase family enzyme
MPKRSPSIAVHYHERTKYHPETIASKSRNLDWNSQPYPFKEYKIGTSYDLKPYLSETASGNEDLEQKIWQRLSRLLGGSYGLTAKLPSLGQTVYLRAAPSAGGLYPAELYLISRGTPFLPHGLYNYQAQTHSLLHFWADDLWQVLQEGCFWHPALEATQLALVTTAVFERSQWRYEDRAYRRICLDSGHLLGNIELNAAIFDFQPHLIGGFHDGRLNELFYLDPDLEGVMTVIALADLLDSKQHLPKAITAIASGTDNNFPQIAEGELLRYMHQATEITDPEPEITQPGPIDADQSDKYNFPFCLKISTQSPPIQWSKNLLELETTIVRRRSTRGYSGENLTFDTLKSLLSFTYQPQDYADQGLDRQPDYFALDLIQTFIAVSGVDGLEEGCYYYAPHAQELRQVRFKNFRRELHFLCLGQELGRDAGAVLFHTADLNQGINQYGDRVYRYLHLDAGHLGQRLNLAAIGLNLGVSGIGGFFDDQVNEVLGIPEDEAVLYITTLGKPRWAG